MAQANTPAATTPNDDPLAHLHKMSTTAGLGSTEYVAINVPSVIAVLLGLASALSLMGRELLIFPVAGVICSIIALRQIKDSNGTQTGRGLAWLGLLLSLGFVAFVGAREALAVVSTRDDQRALEELVKQFEAKGVANEWPAAYGLFSDRFKERVPQPAFTEKWDQIKVSPFSGSLKSATWPGRVLFQTDPTTQDRYARAVVLLQFERATAPARQEIIFKKVGEKWFIEDIGGMFAPPPGSQGPGGPGGPGPDAGIPAGPMGPMAP
jgi:hypothetical protein